MLLWPVAAGVVYPPGSTPAAHTTGRNVVHPMQETAEIRVQFTRDGTNDLPFHIAQEMITSLHESNPYLFGQLFLKAYHLPTSARTKSNGQQQ